MTQEDIPPNTNQQPEDEQQGSIVPINDDVAQRLSQANPANLAGNYDGDYLQKSIAQNINDKLQDSSKFGEPPAGHRRFFFFPRKRINNIQVSPLEVPVDIVKTDEEGNVNSQVDKMTKKILVPLGEDAKHWEGYESIEEDVLPRYVDDEGNVVSDEDAKEAAMGGHNYKKAVFLGIAATAAAGMAIGIALKHKNKASKN